MHEFFYLKLSLSLFLVWLFLFLRKKKQRQEMVLLGLIGAIASPVQQIWFAKDYWHPSYSVWQHWPPVEEIIFGFAIMGIMAVIFEVVFAQRYKELKKASPHRLVFISLIIFGIFGVGLFSGLMTSIYGAIITSLIIWAAIIMLRKDLLGPSIGSGVLTLIFATVGYQAVLAKAPDLIQSWWNLSHTSQILIWRVPLEEYLWFFTIGMAIGPAYEFLKGYKFEKTS